MQLFKPLQETITALTSQFGAIPAERKPILEQVAGYVSAKSTRGEVTQLIFICTHNSRRSHIAQIWAQAAAAHYGVTNVVSYSGGTEATAFNPRAVQAIEKVGFKVKRTDEGENPVYQVTFSGDERPVIAYSKKYDAAENPRSNFAAIMTCSHADENCPVVLGMEKRISLPYDDPKDFDGTALESEKYLERVLEIGKELLYAFSIVKS